MEVLDLEPVNIQVLIEVLGRTSIEIRWTTRLTDTVARAIEEELDDIPGVEFVHMRRYSAVVAVGEHVRRVHDVAGDIWEAFVLEPIQGALRFSMPNATLDVEALATPTIKP